MEAALSKMTSANILELVRREVLGVLGEQSPGFDISPESALVEDLSLSSLEAVSLIMSLEDQLDIELSDDEVAALRNVGDIVSTIESKLAEFAPSEPARAG